MRNYVNNIVNKSKNSYFRNYFSEHSKNAKKVWEGIRCATEWNKSEKNNRTSISYCSIISNTNILFSFVPTAHYISSSTAYFIA